ncbi:hypothetical protein ACSBOB_20015 [Mesorhizobium sp. ASY16-5R]|uniref:hypothetical protein n=1 Tax=Mesorhizobium sp. ASY16-5R TaxID=3445772 RepID=UPI003F9EDA0B
MSGGAQFTKWEETVRNGGILIYDVGSTASGWSTAISTAETRFNALSTALSLKVKIRAAKPEEKASAHILVAAVNGSYTFDRGKSIPPGTGSLPANGNKGATEYKATTDGLVRAYIFLPLNSKHGDFMKVVMAVHEFFHASGLHEHSDLAKPDIMAETMMPSGPDKVEAGVFNSRMMPPIWMSNETGAKIANCWS